ncbi:hypothetical protein [Mesomycoplasma ovipneumoniae]|uniref:hypothetical protein n=1 Tax=Mesomycoplasma ovipneumoniae TaxID=29562 RepID=UPI00308067EA
MKKITKSIFGMVSFSPLALIACGGPVNEFAHNKEIIVAVDPAQTNYWKQNIEEFNKTDSATKNGFKIRTISKNVFAALDFSTVGHTDTNNTPDIFYAPQDRITDLVQGGAVSYLNDFLPNLFDEITTQIGATSTEKENMKNFGTVFGLKNNRVHSEFVGIQHNKEGIVLASTENEDQTRKILQNADTDSLAELVEKGEGLFRIQDFWYGNGVLAGALEKIAQRENLKDEDGKPLNLMSKLLYTKNNQFTSGLLHSDIDPAVDSNLKPENNEYEQYFREAFKSVAKIYYPVFKAAYGSEADFKNSIWSKKGISQADLAQIIKSDMNVTQNTIFRLMKEKKLKFAIIGTWDVQNSEKSADAKSFFNITKATNETDFKQALGSWSFLINSRNNSSSPERKQALNDLFKIMFSAKTNTAYFQDDSKIPFVKSLTNQIKQEVERINQPLNVKFETLKKDLQYTDDNEIENAINAQIQKTANPKYINQTVESNWDKTTNQDASSEENYLTFGARIETGNLDASLVESANKINQLIEKYQKFAAIRNTLATIFGQTDLSKFTGNGESWQIDQSFFKVGIKDAKAGKYDLDISQSDTTAHVRKVEAFLFGANGDEQSEKDQKIEKYSKLILDNNHDLAKLEASIAAEIKEIQEKAKLIAKTPADDATIEKIARAYLNNYVSAALIRSFVSPETIKQTKAQKTTTKSGQTVDKYTLGDAEEIINEYLKSKSFDKILNVIDSDKTIENQGVGILNTDNSRFDRSNPQFSSTVWSAWNDQTFGSEVFHKSVLSKIKSEEDFAKIFFDKVAIEYYKKILLANQGTSRVIVNFS